MAMKNRRKLFERDVHDALVLSSRRISRRLENIQKDDEDYERLLFDRAVAEMILDDYDEGKLRQSVNRFFNKYPLLLAAKQADATMAYINDRKESLVRSVVTAVMFEEDENGEPRMIYVGDGLHKKNPKFMESEEEDDAIDEEACS